MFAYLFKNEMINLIMAGQRRPSMEKSILLVEDNSDDEALAVRAFKKNNVGNKIVVAHDGARRWITCSLPEPIWAVTPASSRS
jgi:hypothetical protein